MNAELARQHAHIRAVRARINAGRPAVPSAAAPPVFVPAPTPLPRGRIAEIIVAVGAVWGVTFEELVGPRKTVRVSRPRQVAMYLAREMTDKPWREIARRFNRADHTGPLAAHRNVAGWRLRGDEQLEERIAEVRRRLDV